MLWSNNDLFEWNVCDGDDFSKQLKRSIDSIIDSHLPAIYKWIFLIQFCLSLNFSVAFSLVLHWLQFRGGWRGARVCFSPPWKIIMNCGREKMEKGFGRKS
jgi:hypothetical protein